MKRSTVSLLIVLATTLTTTLISASGFAAPVSANPCDEIKRACEAAGFRRGGHQPKKNQRRGVFRDCMKKVLNGDSVKGVQVSADKIIACKEHRVPSGRR